MDSNWVDRGSELVNDGHDYVQLAKQLQTRVEAGQKGLDDIEAIKVAFSRNAVDYEAWEEAQWTRFCKQVEVGETQVYILRGERGETEQNPLVVRYSSVVALRVLHPDGHSELFEFKQKADGSESQKKEAGEAVPGISEKLMRGETFVSAAVRGLKEELQLDVDARRIYVDPQRRDRLLYKPDDYTRGFFTGLYVQSWVVQLRDIDNVSSEYSEDKGNYRNVFRWQIPKASPWLFPEAVFDKLATTLGKKPIVGLLRERIFQLAAKQKVAQWKGDVGGLATCLAQATARRTAPPIAVSDSAVFVGCKPSFVIGLDGEELVIKKISVLDRRVRLEACAVSEQTLQSLGLALSDKEERLQRVHWQPWVPVGMAGAASVLNIIFQLLFNR